MLLYQQELLIKDEAVDSVSVGVDVVDASYDDNGTMVIKKANWVELSLVTAPAFKGAMITEVAATEPQEETTTMSEVFEFHLVTSLCSPYVVIVTSLIESVKLI